MKDEEALAKLTNAARDEQDSLEPRWEKLAAGTATDAERAELEALDADRFALYQPLDAGMRDAFATAVMAELAREGAPVSHTRTRDAAPAAAGAKVISLEGRWRRSAAVAAVPLAAAAAAVLLFARGGEKAAMPEYAATWASAERDLRGDPSAPVAGEHVQASERFELVLRPAARVTAPIVARPFIAHDGKREAWRAPVEVSDGGAVRIVGATSSLFPAGKGEYVIVIAIGVEGALPTSADAAFDAVAPREWRKFEGTIHVR